MKKPLYTMKPFKSVLTLIAALLLASGCGANIRDLSEGERALGEVPEKHATTSNDYYDQFFDSIVRMSGTRRGTTDIMALDGLPKASDGSVNWTAAVVQGLIHPKGSLDPDAPEDTPLNLNVFIEAKVPLMSNVLFPHSIHTFWLDCATCHPKIFIPKAGANPMSMEEIFKGEWCGRCHGKVAFTFWPMPNCRRCHIIMKGKSLEKEHWR